MRNLACFLTAVAAFLQNISLPNVFPPFLSDDFAPYLVAQALSPGALQVNLTTSSSYLVTLNSTYVGSFTGNKTISLPSLSMGSHQLAIASGGQTYSFTLLVSSPQNFTHSVAVDSTPCAPDCGSFSQTTPISLTAPNAVQAMLFNYVARIALWTSVQGSQTFTAVTLDNYLVVMEGVGFLLHKGFKTPKSNQPVSFAWKTSLGFTGFSLSPRFHPQHASYSLSPLIESSVGFDISLKATCFSACAVVVDSSTSNFPSVVATSASWSPSISTLVNDTFILSFIDSSGVQSPEYFAISVVVKSRDKTLKSLSLVGASTKDSYAAYTSLSALTAASRGTQLQLIEAFSSVRLQYSLADLDYNATLALALLTEAQSPFANITTQSNSSALAAYWTSNKTFVPVVGSNVITVNVAAQDPGFTGQTTIAFRMLSNNADLQSLDVVGGLWTQSFTPSGAEYSIGMPADRTSFPLVVRAADPRALLSMYSTFALPLQNLTGVLNATIPLPSVAFYNQSLALKINAETRSIVRQIVLWVWKVDICGNGLRYSDTEACDDGNLASGDGCDSLCRVETEFVCTGGSKTQKDTCVLISSNSTSPGNSTDPPTNSTQPGNSTEPGNSTNSTDPGNSTSPSNSTCGDGTVDDGEECDDGNEQSGDGCSSDCLSEHFCGDGVRDPSEFCDDGNTRDGDGCSSNCTVEDGWVCAVSHTENSDICSPVILKVQATEAEQYFAYEYMGVSFGFPFVVLLLALLASAALLRVKGLASADTVWLAAGAAYLVILAQSLYILHDVGLEGNRYKMFAGFSWAHLKFDSQYPPFHARHLASLNPGAHVRFFDNTLVFLLIITAAALLHGILHLFKRPWASIDLWAQIYLVLFQVTHVPILYYTILSLSHLSELKTAYDSINATAALVALVLLLSTVLLYIVSLRKAWGESSFLHFESIRIILCPGIKKPVQTVKKFIGMSSSDLSPVEVPKRLNRSFDETAVRDNNGFDDVENEESTARNRIMSADTRKKKQGATPDFSQFFSESRIMQVRGYGWSLTYLMQFAETIVNTIILAAGDTKLGRIVPPLAVEVAVICVFIWQRPFVSIRYNLAHSCLRVVFALLLLLLAIGSEVDEAGVIAVLFVLMGAVFGLQVFEVCCVVLVLLASVATPGKAPQTDQPQPGVREFTLHDDHLSLEPPESIPDERHPSSDVINEENEDICPDFADEIEQV